jgi:hypothetical protein
MASTASRCGNGETGAAIFYLMASVILSLAAQFGVLLARRRFL